MHVSVYRERGMRRSMRARESSDERIANENMGSGELSEEKLPGQIQEAYRLAGGDEVVGNGGI